MITRIPKLKYTLVICLSILMTTLSFVQLNAQKEVSFLTLNTWQEGTSVPNGLLKIRDIIINTSPDIVAFTEVRNYNNEDWTSKMLSELVQEGHDYVGKFIGGDVSIISKFPIKSSSLIYDGEGSIAMFEVQLSDRSILVACAHLDYKHYACYLPRGYNGGTPDWKLNDDGTGLPLPITDLSIILEYNQKSKRDEQITAFIKATKAETRPVILIGDFNEPSYLDWTIGTKNMYDHHNTVINWPITKDLLDNGFIDAFRAYYPDEVTHPGMTWPSFVDGLGSTSWTPLADERDRIDYIMYKGAGINTSFASIVGPKKVYAYGTVDSSMLDTTLASDLEWPSDHRGVLAILKWR